jgi:hypothetical protein
MELNEKNINKYFDIILLADKKDSFFSVNEILIPKYFKYETSEERDFLQDLRQELKEFTEFHGYFEWLANGSCKLTKKGLKAKGKGGHFKLLEYEDNKENKQDEILDLDVTLKRFESKIGKKIIIAGIIIAFLNFIITISTIKMSENNDDHSKKVEQVNDPKPSKEQEKILDTLK